MNQERGAGEMDTMCERCTCVLEIHLKEKSRGQYAREDTPELDPMTTVCCHSFRCRLPNGVRQSEVSCRTVKITNPWDAGP